MKSSREYRIVVHLRPDLGAGCDVGRENVHNSGSDSDSCDGENRLNGVLLLCVVTF